MAYGDHMAKRIAAAVLALGLLAAGCSSAEPATGGDAAVAASEDSVPTTLQAEDPATTTWRAPTDPIYASLPLDTPESSAQALVDAFADRDFERAWFIFDLGAQRELFRAINNLELNEIRRAPQLISDDTVLGAGEHYVGNGIAVLSDWLEDAAEHGYLHVDLAGASIVDAESIEVLGEGGEAAVSLVLATGEPARLWLTESEAGRWRVRQVAVDAVEFVSDGTVFVDSTCGQQRVRVFDGAACPSTTATPSPELEAEVERIRAEAGNDTSKQIAAAQEIAELLEIATRYSDEDLCAGLQGNALGPLALQESEMDRANALLESTCPGTLENLEMDPPVTQSPPIGERTIYAQLDLSTPESAVVTSQQLYANDAFSLLYFALDIDAQQHVLRSINNLNMAAIAQRELMELLPPILEGEHFPETATIFATIMQSAVEQDLHYIDLGEPVVVDEVEVVEWIDREGEPLEGRLVSARLEASDEARYFLMVESDSGRWRLRRVGSDSSVVTATTGDDTVFSS